MKISDNSYADIVVNQKETLSAFSDSVSVEFMPRFLNWTPKNQTCKSLRLLNVAGLIMRNTSPSASLKSLFFFFTQ